jgi:hypothetical protein
MSGARVETRRAQATGKLDPTCTAPPWPHPTPNLSATNPPSGASAALPPYNNVNMRV